MTSRAFKIIYGSIIFLEVLTVIEPSMRFNSETIPKELRVEETNGQTSRRYFSRYFGKSVAKDDSSIGGASGLSGVTGSMTHGSISSPSSVMILERLCGATALDWSRSSGPLGLSSISVLVCSNLRSLALAWVANEASVLSSVPFLENFAYFAWRSSLVSFGFIVLEYVVGVGLVWVGVLLLRGGYGMLLLIWRGGIVLWGYGAGVVVG